MRAPNECHWVAVVARDRGVGLSGCTKAGKGRGDRVGGQWRCGRVQAKMYEGRIKMRGLLA